jgi:carboxymethylenebutenolidase
MGYADAAMGDQGLATSDGERIPGYRVGDGRGSVVVVHEIFGLTAHVRALADRFAAEGLTAFAIDLFDGKTTDVLEEGFALAQALDWPAATQRIRRAVEALRTEARGPVAVAGFCMGGSLALMAAAQTPSLGPCVCFYGIPPADAADLTRIEGSVLAHFGTRDVYISNDRVDALEQLLGRANVRARLHRYDAEHGFVREEPDGAATTLAWQRTIAFLREELALTARDRAR